MYAPSAFIAQAFTSLFLTKLKLPSIDDVTLMLRKKFDECKYPSLLCNSLELLFSHLEMIEEKLKALDKLSIPSQYFSAQHVTNEHLPLKFFEIACISASNPHNLTGWEVYFCELSMYCVMFNDVSHKRVMDVMFLIRGVNDFIKHFDLNYGQLHDTKACDCDEYIASGDCNCAEFYSL